MQIQISWLLQKPTDLDLHCLQRQGISGLSRTRVKVTFSWPIYPTAGGLIHIVENNDQQDETILISRSNN